MTDEQVPDVEEIKERLKVEIPVEEDAPAKEAVPEVNLADEFRNLGRQFAETLQTVWNSDERQRVETEIRDGVQTFINEVDSVIREARDSRTADKIRQEAAEAKTRVDTSDLGFKARKSVAQGLQWLSHELGELAGKFSVPEKEPEADATAPETAEEA